MQRLVQSTNTDAAPCRARQRMQLKASVVASVVSQRARMQVLSLLAVLVQQYKYRLVLVGVQILTQRARMQLKASVLIQAS